MRWWKRFIRFGGVNAAAFTLSNVHEMVAHGQQSTSFYAWTIAYAASVAIWIEYEEDWRHAR